MMQNYICSNTKIGVKNNECMVIRNVYFSPSFSSSMHASEYHQTLASLFAINYSVVFWSAI